MKKKNVTFKANEVYQNEYTNIFVKHINNGMVLFIEGTSPSAIHDMQEIPEENLLKYISAYGFRKIA